MNLKYTYTLLTLITVLYFVPANAQKKPATKPAATKSASAKKADAQNLGDAAAKVKKDTVGKGGANGANPQQNSGSLSEEIVITTAYKPVLADAVKIRRNPDLEDKVPFKAPLSYLPVDKRLERNSEIRQLNAMKMPGERDSVPLNNFVRAAVGNLKTTYLEGYFGNGRDEALQVSGFVKHIAQQGSIYKQNSSKNEVGVAGKSIGEQNTLSGRIGYSNSSNYFYGYDKLNPPVALDVAHQYFNTISAEGEFAKNYQDVENELTYSAKLQGYNFSNRFKGRESNIVLSGFLNKTIKQFYTGLGASLDLSSQKDVQYSINNSIARANPYIKFQGTNYKIDAGVNIAAEFGFSSRVFIFPAAKAELQVIPKYVRLFVEAKGDVNKTSLRDLSTENPFLGENIAIKNSVDQLDISAGLKGTLAPGLGFKATIFRNSIKDMPLYVSNFDFATGYNRFAVIYDNGKARVSGFTGELDYKTSEDVNIFGRVEFKDYQLATEQTWNLPKFKLTGGTSVNINDKVKIIGSVLFRGDTKDRILDPSVGITPGPGFTKTYITVTNSAFADLSGSVQYKVNNRISIFGQVNNILNSANQTWLYYSDYGFNIFGGASYSF